MCFSRFSLKFTWDSTIHLLIAKVNKSPIKLKNTKIPLKIAEFLFGSRLPEFWPFSEHFSLWGVDLWQKFLRSLIFKCVSHKARSTNIYRSALSLLPYLSVASVIAFHSRVHFRSFSVLSSSRVCRSCCIRRYASLFLIHRSSSSRRVGRGARELSL